MDAKQFMENALRTESVPHQMIVNERAFDALFKAIIGLGLIGDMFKRKLYYGRDIKAMQLAAVAAETADCLKYLSRMAGNMGDGPINARIEGDRGLGGDIDKIDVRLLHCALGCFTESGEMFEALQAQYVGGELNKANFAIELGDTDWYQAIGMDALGLAQGEVWDAVISKLKVRFADKFDATEAVTRDLKAEEKAGEGKLKAKADAPSAEEQAQLKADHKTAASELQKANKSA